jgi:hypothetical protein
LDVGVQIRSLAVKRPSVCKNAKNNWRNLIDKNRELGEVQPADSLAVTQKPMTELLKSREGCAHPLSLPITGKLGGLLMFGSTLVWSLFSDVLVIGEENENSIALSSDSTFRLTCLLHESGMNIDSLLVKLTTWRSIHPPDAFHLYWGVLDFMIAELRYVALANVF